MVFSYLQIAIATKRRGSSSPAGAWANDLLADLGIAFEVRRKPLYWFDSPPEFYHAKSSCPAFLFETAQDTFYGFPQIDELGVKVGRHTGGAKIDNPLEVDREVEHAERAQIETFLGAHFAACHQGTDRAYGLYVHDDG